MTTKMGGGLHYMTTKMGVGVMMIKTAIVSKTARRKLA